MTIINENINKDNVDQYDWSKVTQVNGDIYLYWYEHSFNAPKLKETGYIYATNFNEHVIETYDFIPCFPISKKVKDGIEIINAKESKVVNGTFGGKGFYVASKNNHHAHGDTIPEALLDLKFKTGELNKDQYEHYTLDATVSHDDAVTMYRILTGACKFGVNEFIANNKEVIKESYAIKELINITEGHYGNDAFKQFFGGNL